MAESLPILVDQFEDNPWMYSVRIHGVSERTTVFQYADDMIPFLGNSADLEVRLRCCLFIFSILSGFPINLQKSCLIGVGSDSGEV